MDDDLPFASHIIRRGRTFQYVRRIPDDLKDAIPVSRIQRSLRTRDKAQAYAAAAAIHAEIEKQFAAARRGKGFTLDLVPVDDWGWPDWQHLADWFKAVLIEDDWRVRLRNIPGSAFSEGTDTRPFWRDTDSVRTHIDLQARLRGMTPNVYAQERLGTVQATVRRLGVPISKSMPYFDRLMASCLRAEMEYLAVFLNAKAAESKNGRIPTRSRENGRALASGSWSSTSRASLAPT